MRTSRRPEQEPGPWSTRAESPWELGAGPAEEGRREGSLQVGGRVLSEDRPPLEGHAGLEVQGTAPCSGRGDWEVNWEPEGWVELKDRTGDSGVEGGCQHAPKCKEQGNQSPVRQKGEEENGLRLDSG